MQDVSLRVSERSMTLEGIRRDYMLEEGCNCYSMEISYNRFERRVDLPVDWTERASYSTIKTESCWFASGWLPRRRLK